MAWTSEMARYIEIRPGEPELTHSSHRTFLRAFAQRRASNLYASVAGPGCAHLGKSVLLHCGHCEPRSPSVQSGRDPTMTAMVDYTNIAISNEYIRDISFGLIIKLSHIQDIDQEYLNSFVLTNCESGRSLGSHAFHVAENNRLVILKWQRKYVFLIKLTMNLKKKVQWIRMSRSVRFIDDSAFPEPFSVSLK
jgi:hypothetical protein